MPSRPVTTAWYEQSAADVLRACASSLDGLSSKEAARRLSEQGPNELPSKPPVTRFDVFLRQFSSPLIVILLVAALVSAALQEYVDAGVILAAVMVNTLVGFAQEFKAGRALEALRSMVQPHARVLRDGRETDVAARDVTVGDILILARGDRVVADARFIEAVEFEANEAALTGESMPVKKRTDPMPVGTVLAERANLAFAGTSVMAGRGRAVVVATGLKTEIGKIAEMVQATQDEETPLQVELRVLAKWIAFAVVVITALLFLFGLAVGEEAVEMFETSVAIAVAAIPEGLAVSITVILAIGMQRILKRRALVRHLIAAETLGSVSVICTDKTGTITEGEMRVDTLMPMSGAVEAQAVSYVEAAEDIVFLLEIAMLCNDSAVTVSSATKQADVHGSATEKALMEAGLHAGLSADALRKRHPRLDEIPFDSAYKYMATVNTWGRERYLLVKGAPEKIIAFSTRLFNDGDSKPMTSEARSSLEEAASRLTERGLRVIAVAYKPYPDQANGLTAASLRDLVFVGFFGLRDPLRSDAAQHVAEARAAGVRTVIITGDHPKTAAAIGQEVGLTTGPASVATGLELDKWTDEELRRRVEKINVYARVEPRHKLRIVDAWQARGKVVAMTGDGVNDAPALKSADIGIALGSGTEVAKEASDLVLLNNDLGTITSAIEQGRVIFDNIRKTIVYLMVDSFTELVLIGGSLFFGMPLPLLPAQILWINFIADSFPTVGLTLEPGEPDTMKVPPRPRRERVLNRDMLTLIFLIGFITDVVLLGMYAWLLSVVSDIEHVRAIMFAAVGIDSLIYVFAVKSLHRSIFRTNPVSNPWLLGGVAIGFVLMALALFAPFFQGVFEIGQLRLSDAGILLMMAIIKLVAIEIVKETIVIRHRRRIGARHAVPA